MWESYFAPLPPRSAKTEETPHWRASRLNGIHNGAGRRQLCVQTTLNVLRRSRALIPRAFRNISATKS
jgi:hypothetical protein